MLSELRISGLGVISEAFVEPHPGLTVVTGETGAGKTMVVTALGLAGGGRGDAARVRAGADRAIVESRWLPAAARLEESVTAAGGALDDDGSVITVRSLSAEGRSRAHVGGRSVPLQLLAELTEPLLAVHGQSGAISLLRPAAQRAVIDRYAGIGGLLEKYRAARDSWQRAVAELADRTSRAREIAQREQVLRLGLAEIDKVAPLPGEDADLNAAVRRLENVDELRSQAAAAHDALTGAETATDDPTAIGLAEGARRAIAGSADRRLSGWEPALAQAVSVLGEVGAELSAYLSELDADPAALETALSRQAELKALARRYGSDSDAVLAWATDARAELDRLDSSDEALAALSAAVDERATAVAKLAADLTKKRTVAATKLGKAATAELAHLAMGRAALRVAVTPWEATDGGSDTLLVEKKPLHAGPDGADHVEILLLAHAGAPELPINRGASGGELSRVMLALEVVLAGADTVGTLVFDEVDAGVGGRAASEIGRRLARLAATHQVIVVTHLAQVAAFADKHYLVDADATGTVGSSAVSVVDGADRVTELARMLGGTDTGSALAHAKDLLAAATTG